MIAHVAEASEDRGRVIVRLGAYVPSCPAMVAAALHVARAFQSEVEGLFIEDPQVFAAAALPFVRALSTVGELRTDLTPGTLSFDTSQLAVAVQREIAGAARAARVEFSARVVRDNVITALSTACAERGPWNIIAFAEPIVDDDSSAVVSEAAATVWGTTGYITAARNAVWRTGPIVIALEDTDRLTGMLRAAQRLAAVADDEILILPVAADEIALDWLESEVALLLGSVPGVRVLPRPEHAGTAPVWLAALASPAPRLVLARHGGLVMPEARLSRPLSGLRCPVFLVH